MKTLTIHLTDDEFYMLEANTRSLAQMVPKVIYPTFNHEDYIKKSIEDTYLLLKKTNKLVKEN